MKRLYEEPRHAAQRQIACAITAVLLAAAVVDASAEPEMTFKLSGVRSKGNSVRSSVTFPRPVLSLRGEKKSPPLVVLG
jgi:hypothetical protein